MTAVLSPLAKQQFFDNNGRPLVGGLLFTYAAGTTTKTPSYVNAAGVTPNSNPIVLDYRAECNLWVPPNVGYKYVLAPANDTDPPTRPIWTVDNLVSSQLITLYGGVDTGVADAYVLDFVANFDSYADGIVIYWVPSHDNTGASTVNVNGLGPVEIVQQSGLSLLVGQIIANVICTMMFRNGNFQLISNGGDGSLGPVLSGSFVPNWAVGFSVAPTGTVFWQKIGQLVLLFFGINSTGTSNATSMAFTNLPSAIRPLTGGGARGSCIITDNGAQAAGAYGFSTTGRMDFYKGTAPPSASGFTNSGSKGFGDFANVFYILD